MQEVFTADSYLSLCADATRLALSYLPLRDFQQHCSSGYKERYRNRYGTGFPIIKDTVFESEEQQYVFCAGYFHREIGFYSENHLPAKQCISGAMAVDDVELTIHHLVDQNIASTEILHYLVTHNRAHEIANLCCYFRGPPLRFRVDNLEVMEALASICPDRALYVLFRDWDLPLAWKLCGLRKNEWIESDIEICCGLQASKDPFKIKAAQDILEHGQWEMSRRWEASGDCHIIELTYALAYLDDLVFWKRIWKKFKRLFSRSLYERQADNVGQTLVCYLMWVGAIRIMQWLAKTEGCEFFGGCILHDDEWTVEPKEEYFNREKAAQCVEFLTEIESAHKLDEYVAIMYAWLGDPRILQSTLPNVDALDCVSKLHDDGNLELCLACYKKLMLNPEGIIGSIEVTDKLFLFLLKSGEDVSQLEPDMTSFSYQDWLDVVDCLSLPSNRSSLYYVCNAPTPALYRLLASHVKKKRYLYL